MAALPAPTPTCHPAVLAIGTDWRLPAPPLRESVTRTLTLGAALVVTTAWLIGSRYSLGPGYPLKAVVLYSLVLAIALGYVGSAHPFPRFGIANLVTTVRAGIVSLVAALLGESPSAAWATAIVGAGAIVTVLDGLDGQAARRTGMASPFGARFDMEIDALFVMTLSALVWTMGKAGAWILLAGLLRYVYMAAMIPFAWMRRDSPDSLRRKAICVIQIVGLSLVTFPAFAPPLSSGICAALLLVLLYSFGVDTLWLWHHRD